MIAIKYFNKQEVESLIEDLKTIIEATEPMSVVRPEYVLDLAAKNLTKNKPYELIFYGVDHIEMS